MKPVSTGPDPLYSKSEMSIERDKLRRLLEPCAATDPVGIDWRSTSDTAAQDIRILRDRFDRLSGRPVMDKTATAEWTQFAKDVRQVLSDKSKDLEVASWLLYGLVREKQFKGLGDGIWLMNELLSRYRDDLHPQPIDDRRRQLRRKFVQNLLANDDDAPLMRLVRSIPIVGAGEKRPYIDLLLAAQHADPAKVAADFKASAEATPHEEISHCVDAIRAAIDEIVRLERLGSPVGGEQVSAKGVLEEMRKISEYLGSHLPKSPNLEIAGPNTGSPTDDSPVCQSPGFSSRDMMLRELGSLAARFGQAEPHSFVPYALRLALRWGSMDPKSILDEIKPDSKVWDILFKEVGEHAPK